MVVLLDSYTSEIPEGEIPDDVELFTRGLAPARSLDRDMSKCCGWEVEGRTVIYVVDGITVGFRGSLT